MARLANFSCFAKLCLAVKAEINLRLSPEKNPVKIIDLANKEFMRLFKLGENNHNFLNKCCES
jgi:hypothetical protein